MTEQRIGASFRDPSGFIFRDGTRLYRQINKSYADNYDRLMSSGLYDDLVSNHLLVRHEEIASGSVHDRPDSSAHKIIEPILIPYISYPYEWCFSQLKDAALLTLAIQKVALKYDMSLKDASAYNIQFNGCSPIFIDTLSFEEYNEGKPWVAYRQFCQHFLGPLAIMSHRDVRLRNLLKIYIDGIPLDLTSRLLPHRTYAKYSLLAHVHLHASSQQKHQDDARNISSPQRVPNMSKNMLLALITSLEKAISKCTMPKLLTEWGDYYEDTNYSDSAMSAKEVLVRSLIEKHTDEADTIHDFGSNTGRFSRLIAKTGRYVLSHDIDEVAVERNYGLNKEQGVEDVLPLILDLSNPSPALGWAHTERDSLLQRMENDVVVALALIHHLAISNNVPLPELGNFFSLSAKKLIIEFVPKEDSQVQRLLSTREDIFPTYDLTNFESAFGRNFEILEKVDIGETLRTLYVMERK